MNNKKSNKKIASELKTLKLPFFKCEHTVGKLVDTAVHTLFQQSFGKKYLEFQVAAPNANPPTLDCIVEKNDKDYKEFIDSTVNNVKKSYLPIVYASNLKHANFTNATDFQEYLSRITQQVRYIYDMPRLENQLESIIDNIDNPSANIKLKYFRFMKLQRLKKMNEMTVDLFLTLLHNFYWVDFPQKKENLQTVDFYIARVIPIAQQLHNSLMEQLEYEYPIDEIEKNYNKF